MKGKGQIESVCDSVENNLLQYFFLLVQYFHLSGLEVWKREGKVHA